MKTGTTQGVLFTAFSALAFGAETQPPTSAWPSWRGPRRDGVVAAFAPPARWPEALKREWKVEVGLGHSSPVLGDGRVFLHAREGDKEVAHGLDLATGKEVWKVTYPAPYEVSAEAAAHGPGPKATPTVADGRLHTFGISGILSCLDARDGRVVWRKDFGAELPKTSPLYGAAASPLVVDGRCIAHVGGHDRGALRAFDAATGETRWSWEGDGPGYASPIQVGVAGERQVVTQTQQYLLGVSLDTGKLLWQVPFRTAYDQNAVTAVPHGDLMIYSGYQQGLRALRLAREGGVLKTSEAWVSPEVSCFMSSPVLNGGRLYGFSEKQKGQLFCADPATGKVLWKGPARAGDNASLVSAGQLLLVLNTEGELSVVKAADAAHEIVARYRLADSPTWAHLAVTGNRVLVKDKTTLACWSW